jgi:PKD repeat protein
MTFRRTLPLLAALLMGFWGLPGLPDAEAARPRPLRPTIAGVVPATSPTFGGMRVTIRGNRFAPGAHVFFGGAPAAVTGVTPTAVVAVAPAHAAGAVDIEVDNPRGGTATTRGRFLYVGQPGRVTGTVPTISSVSPASGPASGGTMLTIKGKNFPKGATVAFGGTAASVKSLSATSISAVAPAHAAGTVDVTIGNPVGGGAAASGAFTFTGSPLVASAGPGVAGSEGSAVSFAGSVSGGVPPLSYAWDFGDGTAASGSLSPAHTYRDNGVYTAMLTVTDSLGHTSRSGTSATVANVPPTANAGGPYAGSVGVSIAFSASATDVSSADTAAGFAYRWSFGDGGAVSGPAPTHSYASAGTFTVMLTVTDKDGGIGSASTTVTVASPPTPTPTPQPSPSPLPSLIPTASPTDPLSKPVLNQSNFTYLGSFLMPTSANGWSTAYAMGGLTHRYVNGQLQFLTTSHVYSGGLVYETNYPGIASSGSLPQAQVLRNWGDVYTGQKALQDAQVTGDNWTSTLSSGDPTYGLYYDQNLGRLYWSYGDWYNAEFPYNPSFGYSVLDDSTGAGTGVGAWSLTARPEKFDRGGTLRIPQWFADRFTGGKSLGVGFGGYFSIVNSASFGPALAAVSDPNTAVNPDRSSLDNVPLIGYPADAPDRCQRNADYTSFYDGGTYPTTPGSWNPSGGTGYWTWSDIVYGSGSWIDLPDLQGVLFIAKVGQGHVWYESSDRHAQRGSFAWFVYDPVDLAAVAAGLKQQWQIQPKYSWVDSVLQMPYDQTGWSGDGHNQVGGVTFDTITNRLYILVNGAWKGGCCEWYPEVYVYQVG